MALVTQKKPQMAKANKTLKMKPTKETNEDINEEEQATATGEESASEGETNDDKNDIAEDESSDEVEEDDGEGETNADKNEIAENEESSDEVEEEGDASENNESNEDEQEEGNAGWADSIAKVLGTTKPKTKKSVVLSRAKKLKAGKEKSIEKPKTDYGFEIEGEIKEEKPDKAELKEQLKKRKNLPLSLRVRPSWKDMERERMLRKVATKGVVQLFNAVRIQQKDLQQQLDEAGPLDSRKDAVLNNINKRKFLDVLMSGSRAKSEAVDNSVKIEKAEADSSDEEESDQDAESGRKRKSEWSVLRPDYMTNKKIKHWDEEDNDSDEQQVDSNADSDDE